jgi:hypothetical protein
VRHRRISTLLALIVATGSACFTAASPGRAAPALTGAAGDANGEKTYTLPDGRVVRRPGHDDVIGTPALSPDGRVVAFIRRIGRAADETDPDPTEVVLADVASGKLKTLIRPGLRGRPDDPYLHTETRVTFSPDGRWLYVEAAYPGSSDEVHSVEVATGKTRHLAWGIDLSVLRDGPWRGHLLMGVHTCHRGRLGCDYPIHVVRPDGKSIFVVPGTSGADRAQVLARWLEKRRWRAW